MTRRARGPPRRTGRRGGKTHCARSRLGERKKKVFFFPRRATNSWFLKSHLCCDRRRDATSATGRRGGKAHFARTPPKSRRCATRRRTAVTVCFIEAHTPSCEKASRSHRGDVSSKERRRGAGGRARTARRVLTLPRDPRAAPALDRSLFGTQKTRHNTHTYHHHHIPNAPPRTRRRRPRPRRPRTGVNRSAPAPEARPTRCPRNPRSRTHIEPGYL